MKKLILKLNFEEVFRIGMFWRIIYGFFRIVLGFVLIYFVGNNISNIFNRVIARELAEDKGGFSLELIGRVLNHIPLQITYFIVIYLIFWGIIDVALSYSLLKHKLWSYPAGIVLIIFFIFYEIFRFFHTHSLFLVWIIILDIIIITFIFKEYKRLKEKVLK